jgi:hypothetical protein
MIGSAPAGYKPVIESEPPHWRKYAKCRGASPAMFITERGQPTHTALEACQLCMVWRSCLRYAMENNEIGIWGRTTLLQRRQLRKSGISIDDIVL